MSTKSHWVQVFLPTKYRTTAKLTRAQHQMGLEGLDGPSRGGEGHPQMLHSPILNCSTPKLVTAASHRSQAALEGPREIGKSHCPQWASLGHRQLFQQWWMEQPHVGVPRGLEGEKKSASESQCWVPSLVSLLLPSFHPVLPPSPQWAWWWQALMGHWLAGRLYRGQVLTERHPPQKVRGWGCALWHVHSTLSQPPVIEPSVSGPKSTDAERDNEGLL